MDNLTKYQKVAIQKGGQLLSTSVSNGRRLKWKCDEGHVFLLTPYKVYRRGQWCKQCGNSIGERHIRKVLKEFNIPFTPEYRLPNLPNRRYDFYFEYNGRKYLVEFDGEQHFRFVRKYHKTKSKFNESQVIDRIKTYVSCNSGCYLIRIDYTQLEHIRHHLITAINSNYMVYLSNPQAYEYITNVNITLQQFQQYVIKS
jgi:hypothetical protein